MNKYVKIKFNGKINPLYLLYVDEHYKWTEEQKILQNKKSINIASMAFLDHGQILVPEDSIPDLMSIKAPYAWPFKDTIFLVYESGHWLTLTKDIEIIEEVNSQFYPIERGAAIVCENDPSNNKWGKETMDRIFKSYCKRFYVEAKSLHYMLSFRHRSEEEIIEAFKNAPGILFDSSFTEVDWWELLLRCYIKSKSEAVIMTSNEYKTGDSLKRFELCIGMAEKAGIKINY